MTIFTILWTIACSALFFLRLKRLDEADQMRAEAEEIRRLAQIDHMKAQAKLHQAEQTRKAAQKLLHQAHQSLYCLN